MTSWSRKRVIVLAVVIFVAHVIAIFALHMPAPMVTLPDAFRSPRALVEPSFSTNDAVEMDSVSDPLVFAGAHEHGFSAAAWMMRPKVEYAMTNSTPEPRFLAFSRMKTDVEAGTNWTLASGRAGLPFLEFKLPAEARRSILMVEGGLEKRALARAPAIPIQFWTDVLSNTVVQVGVRADGFPFSARIVSGSGSRAADLAAMDIANNVRFTTLATTGASEAEELQWGELVFQWFTAELGATNVLEKSATPGVK